MCGLSGFLLVKPLLQAQSLKTNVEFMTRQLKHRGPDDLGHWFDSSAGIALGHARLAIIDLSSAGHQPMVSNSGRYMLVFNGEIYNHLEIRKQLEEQGHSFPWKGHSDTETLLAGLEAWGLEATLRSTVGMFSIALWDKQKRELSLMRDRFGEKPLYYGWVGQASERAFVFGSELKALRAYPGFKFEVCPEALGEYLSFMYVPAPRTIHPEIFKLPPGCLLTVNGAPPANSPGQAIGEGSCHGNLSIKSWWSFKDLVRTSSQSQIECEHQALQMLEDALSKAVRSQSLADVPLGAFLSGGVDSSTIVAMMQAQSDRPVKTFTIGFDEVGFDESPHASAVAKHLGTEHYEMRVSAQMAREVIPNLSWIYDEPFADSSQIPTQLVCQAARQHVIVALSGDAGDELFGGYNRYVWGPRIWSKFKNLPFHVRQSLLSCVSVLPSSVFRGLGNAFGVTRPEEKAEKLWFALNQAKSLEDVYWNLVRANHTPEMLAAELGKANFTQKLKDTLLQNSPIELQNSAELKMMYMDTMTYLPDDILCKVDRAAMSTSLETRVPFLNHHLVELAWRLPSELKIRGGEGKWALRQVLYKYVPRDLIERPKSGFSVPIGQWLRGPLKEWAEELLNEGRLRGEGYFRPESVRSLWQQHLSGSRDNTHKLWTVLMFQAWLSRQVS